MKKKDSTEVMRVRESAERFSSSPNHRTGRRHFLARVDPTEARYDIGGRNRLLFGRSPIEQGDTPGRTGRRRAAILVSAP